jgi:hypothetical protein
MRIRDEAQKTEARREAAGILEQLLYTKMPKRAPWRGFSSRNMKTRELSGLELMLFS